MTETRSRKFRLEIECLVQDCKQHLRAGMTLAELWPSVERYWAQIRTGPQYRFQGGDVSYILSAAKARLERKPKEQVDEKELS